MIDDLIIYRKYNDFIYYVYILIDKIPRYEKNSIGLDIRKYLINNLELIIEIYKYKDIEDISKLDTNLLILKNLVRVIYKRKYITIKNYNAFSRKITEISNMVGGYYKKYKSKI